MSCKEWVYSDKESRCGIYQELDLGDENENPAIITVDDPEEYAVEKDKGFHNVSVGIPAKVFDEIALAWCKKRKLAGF
jgi:hypothetical protein|tara:strand:- start:583 stop:816 length:234 start_codon:yes stop_codon:yes gene_type:complete